MADEVSLAVYAWSLAIVAIALALLILACAWPLDAEGAVGRPHHFTWLKRRGRR